MKLIGQTILLIGIVLALFWASTAIEKGMNPLPVQEGNQLELLREMQPFYGTDGEGKFLIPFDSGRLPVGAQVEVLGSRINPTQDVPIFRVQLSSGRVVWLQIPGRGKFNEFFNVVP